MRLLNSVCGCCSNVCTRNSSTDWVFCSLHLSSKTVTCLWKAWGCIKYGVAFVVSCRAFASEKFVKKKKWSECHKAWWELNFTLWFLTGGWIAQIQMDSMHTCSQSPSGSGRVWLCLEARCSQDAFNFLFFTLDLAKTSGYWQESSSDIYFVQILHDVTWSTLKFMYSWNVGTALQNFVLLMCILVMHLEISKKTQKRANGAASHDAALNRCSNVGSGRPKK